MHVKMLRNNFQVHTVSVHALYFEIVPCINLRALRSQPASQHTIRAFKPPRVVMTHKINRKQTRVRQREGIPNILLTWVVQISITASNSGTGEKIAKQSMLFDKSRVDITCNK